MDKEWLMGLLNRNQNMNFVDRILNRNKYPSIPVVNPDGTRGAMTHKMAYSDVEMDGQKKFIAYPEVIYDTKEKKLNYLDSKMYGGQARDYALKNKEYLSFDTEEEAAWFADNGYKLAWQADKAKAGGFK